MRALAASIAALVMVGIGQASATAYEAPYLTDVTGTYVGGFTLTYSDGSAVHEPPRWVAIAQCGERATAPERVTCRAYERQAYDWLSLYKRSLNPDHAWRLEHVVDVTKRPGAYDVVWSNGAVVVEQGGSARECELQAQGDRINEARCLGTLAADRPALPLLDHSLDGA